MTTLSHLKSLTNRYPRLSKLVDEFRQGRGRDLPKWPGWCFLPMAAWYAIACDRYQVSSLNLDQVRDVSELAAIGTWRYSQGVYRLQPDFFSAICDSEISGDLPSEVLYRLPQWSIYVESPGLRWNDLELIGFWAHLEWDANTHRTELRLLLNADETLIPIPLHIGRWTLLESIERAISEAQRHTSINLSTIDPAQSVANSIKPVISILLYICSEEPEIQNEKEPGAWPERPDAKRTKTGHRLFPAQSETIWKIGYKIGEKLAAHNSDELKKPTRAHIRRAHWHGYWVGTDRQKFVYRWLHPIFVGASDE